MAKKEPPKKSTATNPVVPLTNSVIVATDDRVIVTREGYDKLVNELEYLKNVRRREVADRIKEAISYGDLSENSEYEDAKNEQAFVEGRAMEIESKFKNIRIIEDTQKKTASVQLGSTVWIKQTGKSSELQQFVIVGSTEADPMQHRISNVSPVGKALLEARAGDRVKVHVPAGILEYEITKVQ